MDISFTSPPGVFPRRRLPRSFLYSFHLLLGNRAFLSPCLLTAALVAPLLLISPAESMPVAQATTCPACLAPEQPYMLGAGDRVRVDLFQAPQYSGEAEVLIDGTLHLPLVGKVPVQGLTIESATAALSSRYSEFLRRPIVNLTLLERRSLQVGIAGEINRPGSYTLEQPEGAQQYPTLTQLLTLAGGITQLADVRQVEVRRRQPEGGFQTFRVDLWRMLATGDQRHNLVLRDGDSITIPAGAPNLAEASLLANSSFAGDRSRAINIAVVGEVVRPGTYTVSPTIAPATPTPPVPEGTAPPAPPPSSLPTITKAIQLAGGIRPLADIQRVQVRRLKRDGSMQEFQVNLWDLLRQGDIRQDAILQEGDTIIVPTATTMAAADATALGSASFAPGQIRVNVVGEVATPGYVSLVPNSTLNQALLAAGGFNRRSRRESVQLIRLNPDGTVSRREIEVDLNSGIHADNNPTLQNDDVVIVDRSGLAQTGDAIGNVLTPLSGVFSIFDLPFRFLSIF